ncbi:MAG: hypothetical protein RLZ04_2188 [Actinomycetota bacterium]|jgi:hypothetical protein
MAKPSNFTRIVTMGMEALKDTSALTAPRKFYKNGERGHIHSNRFCYKLSDSHLSRTVELTFAEAAGKRQCSSCFDAGTIDGRLEVLLKRLLDIDLRVRDAEMRLESKRGIGDSGATLTAIREARDIIAVITEDDLDLVDDAVTAFRDRLDTAERRNHERLGQNAGKINAWAAGSLMRSQVNNGTTTLPGVDTVTAQIFGYSNQTGRPRENHIDDVYEAWCAYRRHGVEQATAKALELTALTELRHPWQLGFPIRGTALVGDLLTGAERLWREELQLRLHETLFPAWEQQYASLVALETPRVVGINGYSLNHDQSRTILASHPTSETEGSGVFAVTLVPEILARWLAKFEDRWSTNIEVVNYALDPELLDAARTLWQPKDSASEFHRLEDAVQAAAAI